ncbi:MAG TPA: c-type cytochrome [Vicinamibacterales bacterium]|nr:c-type cytochrome [Vicinamibacterales bacterium]
MQRKVLTTAVLAVALGIVPGSIGVRLMQAAGEQQGAAPARTQQKAPDKAAIERGEYLVRIMGCHDCHTPHKLGPNGPERDMSRALTGHPQDMTMPPAPKLAEGPWVWTGAGTMTAFAGPWGVSFTANLTPDPETGLGNWTEEMFISAMRTGRHEGKGRPILPPMPYFVVAELTDPDIKALFAYLQSLKPVKNRVPQPIDPPEASR